MTIVDKASDVFKVLVVGAHGVGKTAFCVRLLTGRYIGSYETGSSSRTTRRDVAIAGGKTTTELVVRDLHPEDVEDGANLVWPHAVVVLCSRDDVGSVQFARSVLTRLRTVRAVCPSAVALVANKSDVDEDLKPVARDACHDLALDAGCLFFEMSARDSAVSSRLVINTLVWAAAAVGRTTSPRRRTAWAANMWRKVVRAVVRRGINII